VKKENNEYKKLPHIEVPGHPYFISFRTKQSRIFNSKEKDIIFETIKFHNGKKYYLISFVIMSDHVHLMLNPLEKEDGFYDMSEIMHSVKSYSSQRINKMNNQKGNIWQADYYDKIIWSEKDLLTKLNYIIYNPVKSKLVEYFEEYKWLYVKDFLER